jgi:RHS repeat-associated protein
VILGPTTPTAIHYFRLDERGNVLGAYDESSVTMTVAYDDWGVPSITSGTQIGNLMWKGLHRDEYTGLYYARARWYDPTLGRFLSEDPAGFAGGVNPYTFADNDPINGSDPSGLFSGGSILGAINRCGLLCQFASDIYRNRQPSKIPAVPPLRGVNPGYANGDASAKVAGWGGIVASGVEIGGEGRKIGSNLRLYSELFNGNQYVSVMELESVGKLAGYSFFVIGTVADYKEVVDGHKSVTKFGVNTAVGGGALWIGGIPGALVGGTYFAVDNYVPGGWGRVLLGGEHDASYARGQGLVFP